jgi:hypothetical protein
MILRRELARRLHGAEEVPGAHKKLLGVEHLDKVIEIDQAPIGRTPRSNPATYTGVWDLIRDLFANQTESLARGYKKGRFSFNVAGGRCGACGGAGVRTIDAVPRRRRGDARSAAAGAQTWARRLEIPWGGTSPAPRDADWRAGRAVQERAAREADLCRRSPTSASTT